MTIGIDRWTDAGDGCPAAATDGRAVYAVGDVHGRYDLLAALLGAIAADVAAAPERSPLLVFLGDYVDRGPRSADVLTTLVWLSRHASFEVVSLRGNHEEMMLAFLDRPWAAAGWLRAGGADTLRAYGVAVAPDGEEAEDDPVRLRDALMDRLPASHLAFLRSLETRLVCGDHLFVHAGVRPGVPLRRQSDADLLWIRDEFLQAQQPFGKLVVHGHSWHSDRPVRTPHRIGVDTGAYATGVLTAVRLAAGAAEFIQARGDPSGSPSPRPDGGRVRP